MNGTPRATIAILLLALSCLRFGPTAQAQETMPAIPFLEEWRASPHANSMSESFTHWNKEGTIPVDCATCHSSVGFRDFLGADGSTAGKVDRQSPVGSVVDCVACHNDKTVRLQSVVFPSGLTLGNLGKSASCMICHQGRQSTPDVNRAVTGLGEDMVSPKLRFINIHYRAAAATLWGTNAKGGYEYAGKLYHGRFEHTPSFATCHQCHDPHRLSVNVSGCATCHAGQAPKAIRTSRTDFDGDGDVTEGIAAEIASLHGMLGRALTVYARDTAGVAIVYRADTHPYFFVNRDGDGTASDSETVRANAYSAWTPRLLRAAYNYQFIAKDPGAYSHNPLYALQLLYDSLESLAAQTKMDMSSLRRP